ncbi:hypothetical protein [Lewinella sp. 4G2]|uniref:hypothetical protein n=1 Tax=Lewinella sp. 4G2 TaxID=1803372 RepID=UPI0007B46EE6|nr:hypothetical protein [Lewinella sp. 4G2]OAV45095.1 hypothetical protein A3850_011615 [Lewinella sp. 4G2]
MRKKKNAKIIRKGAEEIYAKEVGEFQFIAGFTSGGYPYGIMIQDDQKDENELMNNNSDEHRKKDDNQTKIDSEKKDQDLPF